MTTTRTAPTPVILVAALAALAGCDDTGGAAEPDAVVDAAIDAGPALPTCDGVEIPTDFVCIGPGTFYMGTAEDDRPRGPDEDRHAVTITRPFMMAIHEVTQRQWVELMGDNPSWFSEGGEGCPFEPCEERPVERITWYEALAWLNARSEADGLSPCYTLEGCTGTIGSGCEAGRDRCLGGYRCVEVEWLDECDGYRLPTEAEWEYAARAGTEGRVHGRLDDLAWYFGTARQRTRPIASKDPSPWGVYDMYGNVFEWTWDIYARNYGFFGDPDDPVEDPRGPEMGDTQVIRGCGWNSGHELCRSAARQNDFTAQRRNDVGLRAVRNVPAR